MFLSRLLPWALCLFSHQAPGGTQYMSCSPAFLFGVIAATGMSVLFVGCDPNCAGACKYNPTANTAECDLCKDYYAKTPDGICLREFFTAIWTLLSSDLSYRLQNDSSSRNLYIWHSASKVIRLFNEPRPTWILDLLTIEHCLIFSYFLRHCVIVLCFSACQFCSGTCTYDSTNNRASCSQCIPGYYLDSSSTCQCNYIAAHIM